MEPAADAPRSFGDAGLRPRWLRLLASALYLATAACVAISSGAWPLTERLLDVPLSLTLVAYCLTYAMGVARARRSDPTPTDPRPYVHAFGDGSEPEILHRVNRDTAVLVTLVLHALCGLLAGVELVHATLAEGTGTHLGLFHGGGIQAGEIGVLVGWIPAVALVRASRSSRWVLVAGVLCSFLLLALSAKMVNTF